MTTYVQVCTQEPPPLPGQPCASPAWLTLDQAADFPALGITPESIMAVFSWGMGAVLLVWGAAFAVRAVIETIRKL